MAGNLAHNLVASAARHPECSAVRAGDSEWSYAALDGASARVAALLTATGLSPGDRVGIMLPNVPYFPIAFYGVLRAGGVVVPMNVLLKEREVAHYLHDSGAGHILVWHGCAAVVEAVAAREGTETIVIAPGDFEALIGSGAGDGAVCDRNAGDTAVILYTSGTTGTPKGAELTHGNLRRNVDAAIGLFGLDTDSVVFGALPLFHAFGQTCAMNAAIAAGGCLALLPRFTPEGALDLIERHGVTVFAGVPTMYTAMLHHPQRQAYDVSSLRVCASGGAALPVEVLHGFEGAFGCTVLEGYGLSETSPIASFNHPDRPRRPGSIGLPIDGVEMDVVDDQGRTVPTGEVGEIVIRGHNVMKGYWNRADATAAAITDGWFHSGDMARRDDDGYFYIVDRKKDLIIRGGYNVYPREIEEVLYEHPAVREAAVVGIPDDQLGEEVGAAIVLTGGATATAEELREYVKGQVAAYKYPRHVWLVDELPKGPTGKILKREIALPAELVATP